MNKDIQKDLYQSIVAGNVDRVQYLLSAGADPNKPFVEEGDIPALAAIRSEQIEVLKILVDCGADILSENSCSCLLSAIHVEADGAHQMGDVPVPVISKYLLEIGLDPHAKNDDGVSALDEAIAYEYQAFVELVANRGTGS